MNNELLRMAVALEQIGTVSGEPLLRTLANLIIPMIKRRARVRTGRMRDGTVLEEIGPRQARITNRVTWAVYVHEGTPPHIIRAKTPGGVLSFPSGAKTVFARSARHPGFAGDPFFDDGVDDALRQASAIIGDYGETQLRKVAQA